LSENSPYYSQNAMDENQKKVEPSKKSTKIKSPTAQAPTSPANNVKPPKVDQVKSPQETTNQSTPKMTTPTNKPTLPPNKPTAASVAKTARESVERAATASAARDAQPAATKPIQSKPSTPLPPSTPIETSSSIEPVASSKVETLTPLRPERNAALAQPMAPVSRWAFWKKGRQRDEQLIRLSEGYVEMVDMVRSIRDQADAQYQNNLILRESLVHLPSAIQSLEGFGKSHEQVGVALEKINEQMETNLAKDERMANTMDGFNDTLKVMNGTTKATIQTFDRVQERMRDSDIRMENLFSNVRQSEEKVGETMTRLQRNMSLFQAFFMLCLLGIFGVLIYLFINKESFSNKVVQVPVIQSPAVESQAPVTPPVIEAPVTPEETPETAPVQENPTPEITPTPEESSDIVPADILPADLVPEQIQPIDLEPSIEAPASEEPQIEEPPAEPQVEEPTEEPTL